MSAGIYNIDLVVFKLRTGVIYLSFSIDTAPQLSYEIETGRTDPYRHQEMAIQAHQAFC